METANVGVGGADGVERDHGVVGWGRSRRGGRGAEVEADEVGAAEQRISQSSKRQIAHQFGCEPAIMHILKIKDGKKYLGLKFEGHLIRFMIKEH
ncbi:hypothetical protein OsJ_26570 [Oryza sativa Japonica Group]|uniref:Uncharacterized protein n=1 Tax=Oryza sativa subsp. japonica TaxID=39947 RepID=A3BR30_ORYSJ|nr:hypothetical protein OsJ_26570 [Oryza sativa Japonica Group]